MKNLLGALLIAGATLAAVGCVTPAPNMKFSEVTNEAASPAPDQALVYFIRPNQLGFVVTAAVYDGDEFVGFVPYNQKLPYLTKPGEHMFMVVSEAADFMRADLQAGKTYYARVVPRMGAWRARFSLDPISADELNSGKAKQWIEEATPIKNSPGAYQWAQDNKPSVMSKKEKYFEAWRSKDPSKQPYLKASDGM